jgi:DNA-binding transcriptional MocR family regulator
MMVSALCQAGDFDTHVARLRRAYRERRDALARALSQHLPEGCSFATPGGGYFIWIVLPSHVDTAALVGPAEAHKVSFIPGRRLCIDGGGSQCLRLAFSLMKPDALAEGARRLGTAIADAI